MPPHPGELPDDLTDAVERVAAEARPPAEDDEVPEPGRGPERLGLVPSGLDGTEHVAGDVDVGFPVQSVLGVCSLTAALRLVGEDVLARVGREPSADPVDSLVHLERERGVPRNPFPR